MDTFRLFENFITPAERRKIIAWANTNRAFMHTHQDLGPNDNRLSHNIRTPDWTEGDVIPPVLDELDYRMEEALGMNKDWRLKYKVVVHEQGADTPNHVDVYSGQYPNFFRAALLVKKATRGGFFQVGDQLIEFPERALLQFLGSTEHGVTEVTRGQRILVRANWGWPVLAEQ